MSHLNFGQKSRAIAFNFISRAMLCLLLSIFGINEPVAQATPGTGENGWVWQNPLPEGNPLYGITCPTATNCFAVGDGGTVVATTGGSWTALTSGTTKALRSISCINSTTCYAAGDNGAILKTTDSGTTWTSQNSGTTGNLKKIACFAPDTCYAITDHISGVLKTIDGCTTWTTIKVIDDLRDLTCPDINTCFTIDKNTIYKTADGGTNWQSYPISLGYSGSRGLVVIICVDTITCYLAANGDKGLGGISRSILKTTDSGNTWNDLPNSPPFSSVNSYSAITCPDADTCYLVGSYGNGIIKTIDGGTTWTFPYNTSDLRYSLNATTCLNSTSCYFAGTVGRIFQTDDGGITLNNKLDGISNNWQGVDCLNNAVCYVAGDNGKILKTVTGGNLWTELNTGTNQKFTAIKCLTTLICYAAGSNGVYKTTDGGNIWNNRSNGISLFLWAISCPTLDICYTVGGNSNIFGSGSAIYKSIDGGDNWNSINSPVSNPLTSVNCPDTETCYIANTGLYKTFDGGANWTSNQILPISSISSISCVDSNNCYAVRRSYGFCAVTGPPAPEKSCEAVLKTINGGNSWNVKPFGNTYDIICQNLTTCFAVGNDGRIAYTNDGGTTWTYTNAAYGIGFTRISCPSTCTAIGNYGVIMSNHNFQCVASLVKNGDDDGTCGTLRYALSVAKEGDTVTFDNNLSTPVVINLTSGLNLPKGVALDGQNKCGPDGPGITLQGNGAPGNGLTLNGNNTLRGLRIEGFGGNQIAFNNSRNNRLSCVVLKE